MLYQIDISHRAHQDIEDAACYIAYQLKILLPHRILFAEHSAPLTRWKNSRLGFPLYETLS